MAGVGVSVPPFVLCCQFVKIAPSETALVLLWLFFRSW